jgi:putative intracellular protease/amidase
MDNGRLARNMFYSVEPNMTASTIPPATILEFAAPYYVFKEAGAEIESFLAAGKPIALVCHAPGALRHVKTAAGKPLVEGKNVIGFTHSEEEAAGLTKVVPFLV